MDLDEILEEYDNEVEMIITDPDLNHAQSLEASKEAKNEVKKQVIDWALGCLPEPETKVSDNFNDGFNRAIEIATKHIKGER